MQTKSDLRHTARALRLSLGRDAAGAADAAEIFFRTLAPFAGRIIAGYWPRQDEFDSRPLLGRLLAAGMDIALPVISIETRLLRFARWNGRQALAAGPFGIAQPATADWVTPDLIILPLLGFDAAGHRLGYGGGYYDATLAALRAVQAVTAVGLAYEEQWLTHLLPAEAHDVPLDWVITPRQAHCFLPHKPYS